MIYKEMSSSEKFNHPGYWGGIVLVGRDTTLDIRAIRSRALEECINQGTALIRRFVCQNDAAVDFSGKCNHRLFNS